MMSRILPILLSLGCLLFLSACWDEKSIQETNYFTSLALDYEEENKNFLIDATLLNLTSLAKMEGSTGSGMQPTYIGHSHGPTVQIALDELYRSSQLPPSLDQLMTVVVNERSIRHIDELLDGLNRSRATRYNINLIATTEKPLSVLESDAFFQSPLFSFLYQPDTSGPAKSRVKTLDLQSFVRDFRDKTVTTLLPSLKLDKTSWNFGGKKPSFLKFSGAYAISPDKKVVYLSEQQLQGVRWLRSDANATNLRIEEGGQALATLNITRHSHKLTYNKSSNSFILKVSLEGFIHEITKSIQEKGLRIAAEQNVKEQLKEGLQLARDKHMDLFNLEEEVYRYHLKTWKKLKKEKTEFEKLPVKIEAVVHITHMGKLKEYKH